MTFIYLAALSVTIISLSRKQSKDKILCLMKQRPYNKGYSLQPTQNHTLHPHHLLRK